MTSTDSLPLVTDADLRDTDATRKDEDDTDSTPDPDVPEPKLTRLATSSTALLVVDMQNGVLTTCHDVAGVTGRVGLLVEKARAAGGTVIWVRNVSPETPRGTEAWKIVPELRPLPTETVLDKEYGDSFEATDLGTVLASHGIDHVVVCGAQTDACIRSTLHGAFVRGYGVTLVSDGHTTEDLTPWGNPAPEVVIAHTNLYWQFTSAPGREGQVAEVADIEFV
ncbi:isochorismatase family protein [Brevibacterium litoralis]|uniref:isochorismatase family protein n=1 Tax=Brevibacterium litoralis TaxID=3138935 RepID=UPI0032F06336